MRFLSHAHGRVLLRQRPDLLSVLEGLRPSENAQPTFGDAYLQHIAAHELDLAKLVQLERSRHPELAKTDPDLWWFAVRVALIHDLWHALTGYGGDPQGEYQLLWFTWAQDQEPMVLALASVAFLSSVTDGLASVRHKYKLAMEAIHRGRRAIWLLPLPYENLLGEPISEVREQLRI